MAAGPITLAGVTSGGGASVTASGTDSDVVITNGLGAVGDVAVSATGDIRAPFIVSSAGDLLVSAPNGNVSGLNGSDGITLRAGPGRAFSVTVGGAAHLGDVVAENVSISATSISAGRIDAGTLDLAATAGDLLLTGPATARDISLSATGTTSLQSVTASGSLTVNGGAAVKFTSLAGRTVGVTGGQVSGGRIDADDSATVTGSTITLQDATATNGLSLTTTAGDLRVTNAVTAGSATLTAAGLADLHTVTTTGLLDVAGHTGVTFDHLAGGTVRVRSDAAIGGDLVEATGSADLSAASITLGELKTGAGAIATARAGDLRIGSVTSGGDADLSASGLASITGAVTSGGAYRVTGGSVALGGTG